MSDILLTKGQEQERAQRRMEKYRARHEESIPRFEHTFNSINEQQRQDTLNLRQRFLEPRAKKSSKKTEKKTTAQQSPVEIQNPNTTNVNTASKLPKRERSAEEIDLTEQQNGHEQNKLVHCNGSASPTFKKRKSDTTTSITKFPPESVHHTKNGSNSTLVSNLKPIPKDSTTLTPAPARYGTNTTVAPPELCMKQENHEVSNFADLDQCAAALEKDGTTSFSTSMGYIEGTSDGFIPSDTLKDLIFDVSDLNPDFIGDFDFDEDRHSQSTNQSCYSSHYHTTPITPSSVTFSPRNVKMEEGPSPAATSTASPLPHQSQTPPQATNMFDPSSSPSGTNHSTSRSSTPNASYCPQTASPTAGSAKPIRMPYESPTMGHDSPAAQTLKQMAAHHQQQHKQLEISAAFQGQASQSNSSPVRSPFGSDPYSPMNGDFVPTGQAAFRNVRCHSGDGVVVKQENPGPMYGACPSYPRSPVDLIAMAKRSKSPGTIGHSKSFTQAHLNPQLPPSYRSSFSPPTTFSPSNQPIFMQHKMNSSQQMTLQQQHSAVHQGPQMTMGQDLKGSGLPMSHHQPFPPSQYYQATGPESCFPGALQQDKGQTINFTQQHLRLSQQQPIGSGHSQQQPMGRMTGHPNAAQQQSHVAHMDRSRPPLRLPSGGGVEVGDVGARMSAEVQHRMMMRDGGMSGGNVPGNDMMNRFNNGNALGPGPGQGQGQRLNPTHRHQLIGDTGYHHPHQQMGPQMMGLPLRRQGPCPLPGQDNRISNQNQTHSQAQHHDTWHPHSALPDHVRSFHQQQHFHSPGVSQQPNMSFLPNQGGFGSYSQNQRLSHSAKCDGKVMGSSEESGGGVILKTEADSSEFNLLLEGMGDDFTFDPASSYQNILDTF